MEMTHPITITLNGNPQHLDGPVSIDQLLGFLGLAGRPVVVELNQQAVFPRDYAHTAIQDGATLELVTLAAGG